MLKDCAQLMQSLICVDHGHLQFIYVARRIGERSEVDEVGSKIPILDLKYATLSQISLHNKWKSQVT